MTTRQVLGGLILLPVVLVALFLARGREQAVAPDEAGRSSSVPPGPERVATSADSPAPAPRRIASLTLGTDEVLSALVSPERVVCVTSLVDDADISNVQGFYPANLPRVRELELERIVGLTPDLVCVASYNSADTLQVLERAGLRVHRGPDINSLDEIQSAILDLGEQVGELQRAQDLVQRFANVRKTIGEQLARNQQRPRVLYWASGYTAGKGTTIDNVIREAGGVNAAAEQNVAGDVDPERVIGIDPEYVLCPQWPGYETDGGIEKHPVLRSLRAVQAGNVVRIPARLLTSVSHFACEGLEQLARRLHPECFDDSATTATKLSAENNP